MSSRSWVEPDVHSWSQRMSNLVREDPSFTCIAGESEVARLRSNVTDIKRGLRPSSMVVVDKIVGRQDYTDHDLCNVNPMGLLQLLWEELDHDNADDLNMLDGVLDDIGGTCLQGDTHRLFSHLVAIRRSRRT